MISPEDCGNAAAPSDPEAALIARFSEGDTAAFAEYYDLTIRRVYSIAWRLVRNSADADEIVQDAYQAAWTAGHTFDPARGPASVWLNPVCRRKAIDRWRVRRRTDALLDSIDQADSLVDPAPSRRKMPEDEAAQVRSAVATLAPQERKVVELAFYSGCNHSEIARRCQAPLGTIKARIRRALQKLRARPTAFCDRGTVSLRPIPA